MNLDQAIDWLREQSERVPFGEVSLHVKLHQGNVPIIETTVTERHKAPGRDAAGGGNGKPKTDYRTR